MTRFQWVHQTIEKQCVMTSNQNPHSSTSNAVRVGKVHHVYASVRNNVQDVRRAEVKARLLTGTYTLQSNRAKFNQSNVSPTCQLCNKNPETREHFLTSCESLNNIRTVYINKIRSLFEHYSGDINTLLDDPASCTQLLLDASHPDIENTLHLNSDQTRQLELYSRSSYLKSTWKGRKSWQ